MDNWKIEGSTLAIISGGGAAQIENAIGCIKAIQQIHKTKFDYMMGTSAGAIVASMLMSFDQDISKFENTVLETPMNDWYEIKYWSAIKTLFKGKFNYVAKPTGIKKFVNKYLTADASNRVKVAISEMGKDGKFVKAHMVNATPDTVIASMSFQNIFPPVEIDGTYYADGGVNDNIPLPKYLDIAKYEHIYLILAPATQLLPNVSFIPVLDRLFSLADNTMNRELAQIEQLHFEEARNITVIKPEEWVDSAGLLNWSKNFSQIKESYELAKKILLKSDNPNQADLPGLQDYFTGATK